MNSRNFPTSHDGPNWADEMENLGFDSWIISEAPDSLIRPPTDCRTDGANRRNGPLVPLTSPLMRFMVRETHQNKLIFGPEWCCQHLWGAARPNHARATTFVQNRSRIKYSGLTFTQKSLFVQHGDRVGAEDGGLEQRVQGERHAGTFFFSCSGSVPSSSTVTPCCRKPTEEVVQRFVLRNEPHKNCPHSYTRLNRLCLKRDSHVHFYIFLLHISENVFVKHRFVTLNIHVADYL